MRIAVLGAGRIGRIHANNLRALADVSIACICDPITSQAEALAQQTDAPVGSVDQVFADPTIDAVVIASSTDTHSELLLKAAEARKHVFCEKPIDLSLVRAEQCRDAIQRSGITCMLGFQRRFDPTFFSAKTRIEAGEIGTPEVLIITSRDPGAPPVSYLKGSGGIFRDMLIHDFDICRWILDDEIVSVHATASCLTDPSIAQEAGDFDTTAVTLRSRQGRLCQINTSRRAAYGYDQRFEVLGDRGMIQCGNHRPTEVVHWGSQHISIDLPEHFFLERYRDAYRLEMQHFLSVLKEGGSPRTSIEDGVAAQRLADAATESARTGQVVQLAEQG
ncbi:MAG: inositol 2-dehydrogenase [Lautropia sp.]|nr:inositol 2-dehydrogenase [Lautropia sp.]